MGGGGMVFPAILKNNADSCSPFPVLMSVSSHIIGDNRSTIHMLSLMQTLVLISCDCVNKR